VEYLDEDVAYVHVDVLTTGVLYGGLESRFKLTEIAVRKALRRDTVRKSSSGRSSV